MDKSVEATRQKFTSVRAGRATPSLLDRINVDYYGSPTPLQQLASFTAPEARVIIIAPYDMSAMAAIEKAIRDSDLGVNPTDDGKVLRVSLPELTQDRRKEYVKLARTKAEEGRVAVRSIRRSAKQALDKAEKDGDIGQDDNTVHILRQGSSHVVDAGPASKHEIAAAVWDAVQEIL